MTRVHGRPSLIKSLIFSPPSVTPRRRARMRAAAVPGILPVEANVGRHQPCDGFAAPGNQHFLAGLNPVEQLAELAFGLKGPELLHGSPNGLVNGLGYNSGPE